MHICYKRYGEKETYVTLSTDYDVLNMIDECEAQKFVDMYVVANEEHNPSASNNRQQSEQPHCYDDAGGYPGDTNVGDLFDSDIDIADDIIEESSDGIMEEDLHEDINEDEDDSSSEDMENFRIHTYETEKQKFFMAVGNLYDNVYMFRDALRDYAICNHFETRYIHNEKHRVTVRCAKPDCSWRLHASKVQGGPLIQVKTVKGEHTCEAANVYGNKMATSNWICNKIIDWIRLEPNLTIKAICARIKEAHHVQLHYARVWRGRELAFEKLYGNVDRSFQFFPSLYRELEEKNPRSIVFVCFKACSDGFIAGCRPYLGLDGCHLKGKYLGDLLAATAWDANYGIFPLAFAVVNIETGYTWKWFLDNIREAIGEVENLTLMSDRQKGLDAVVVEVFPRAEHRVCFKHFYENFKRKFPGKQYKKYMCGVAKAYIHSKWEDEMKLLEELSKPAREWVRAQNEKGWTRSVYGTTAKVHYYTNCGAESFNRYILEDRARPYVDLIDCIRQKMMTRMEQRRRHAQSWQGKYTPTISKYIQWVCKEAANVGVVYRSANEEAEVQGKDDRCTIRLDTRYCSCGRWQICGFPCVHAVAFILSIRRNVSDYIDDYFTIEKYRATYAASIAPLPDKKLWKDPEVGLDVFAPQRNRPRGRPRKKRIRGPNEELLPSGLMRPTKVCGQCGERGHNRRSCKEPIGESASVGAPSTSNALRSSNSKLQSSDYKLRQLRWLGVWGATAWGLKL
ncbi:uncharacterized protein [Typha angustifolia]|uniref:uncharacterized protein n=1 Tax=Typha angustifolia TaxID=59011 RepID=UPI003C2FEE43